MSALLGKLGEFVGVGGFVINPGGLMKHAHEAWRKRRVAAIGVADAWVGGGGEQAVWHGVAFGSDEVHVQRHVVKASHLAVYVAQFGLFFKQETHGGHAVL